MDIRTHLINFTLTGWGGGDKVVVYATWGDLTCRYCRQGKYRIIKVGEHGEVPGPEVFWMKDFDKWYKLSFLLGTSEGYVLINTGLPDDLSLRNKFSREWAGSDRCKFSHVYKIEDALGKLGITPDDISYVIISPVSEE